MSWPIVNLGELCKKITDGSHNPPSGIEQSKYMMLSSKNVFDDEITFDNPRFLNREEFFQENKRTDVSENDILLTIVGTVGRVAVVSREHPQFTLQRSVAVLKPMIEKIEPRFLMYSLRNMLDVLLAGARGVAQKGIYLKQLRELEIPLPPLAEQKRIAAILDKADAIRRKRQQAIQLADDFLRATFLDMFGDPVTNPKGWDVKPLKDLVVFKTGKLDSNAAVEGGCYPFFTCSRENFQINTYAFDCEALLLAGNNAAADYSVKYYKGKFNAYQRTYVITILNNQLSYRYLQVALEMKLQELKRLSKGTNTKYLTLGILNNIMILVPNEEARNRFDKVFDKIEQTKEKHLIVFEMINSGFNSLTQRAFRGEL